MALIKWSALIADMRGKLNGAVMSRNRYAAYARIKVTPYNPQTPSQQTNRSMFAQLSQMWRTLTQEQRNSWNMAVHEFLKTNIFGDSYKPAGINLFIRLNMNLNNIHRPIIYTPPKPEPVDLIKILSINLNGNSNHFSLIVESSMPINHFPVLYVTRPLSPGINFVKSEFRIIDFDYSPVPAHPDQYQLDFSVQYKMKFGALSNFLGQCLFVKVMPIDVITGINSVPLKEKVIIQ